MGDDSFAAGMVRSAAGLVDTHCHLDVNSFAADRDEVVARAGAAGVGRIIVPAIDLGNTGAVLELAARIEGVYAAVGVHPNSAAGWQDDWIDELRRLAARPEVVAIGEIGLDYYWDKTPPKIQHHALARQLELAHELSLPVIIHNREANEDTLAQLAASPLRGDERPGVLHSFSGDWAMAEAALAMGFYLGFTGPLTYKKADEMRAVATRAPLERLLIETDAPYLTPQPYRGKRNEPAYVRLVAERLAELRGLPVEEIVHITTTNAERLFQLPAVH
ncbi:MAG: TatD family hydrolase [Candidatus Promineofilum sp.]|nr:TatD family hydrolase [Promineifilum sp.]